MNITRSSQNLDTTKALSLRYAQWKHCSCGISIGNIVLVVFFNGKTITVAWLGTAGNAGWSLAASGQETEMLNKRVTLRHTRREPGVKKRDGAEDVFFENPKWSPCSIINEQRRKSFHVLWHRWTLRILQLVKFKKSHKIQILYDFTYTRHLE